MCQMSLSVSWKGLQFSWWREQRTLAYIQPGWRVFLFCLFFFLAAQSQCVRILANFRRDCLQIWGEPKIIMEVIITEVGITSRDCGGRGESTGCVLPMNKPIGSCQRFDTASCSDVIRAGTRNMIRGSSQRPSTGQPPCHEASLKEASLHHPLQRDFVGHDVGLSTMVYFLSVTKLHTSVVECTGLMRGKRKGRERWCNRALGCGGVVGGFFSWFVCFCFVFFFLSDKLITRKKS